jgi:hypothetical protein
MLCSSLEGGLLSKASRFLILRCYPVSGPFRHGKAVVWPVFEKGIRWNNYLYLNDFMVMRHYLKIFNKK